MSLKLTIQVSDIESVRSTFNVIRIKRSTTGENGVYELLTANTPRPAVLTAPNTGPYDVFGKTLTISIDNQTPISIVFAGSAPLVTMDVVNQINAAVGDTVAYDEANALKLESTITGTGSAVEVVSGDAVPEFGWSDGDIDIGEAAHVALIENQSLYNFTDANGDGDYFYKAQYYNEANDLASNDSDPFKGEPGTVVGEENLSVAVVDLADGSGFAIAGQQITFYSTHDPIEVDGFQIALARAPITIETDNAGHAEVILVRGLKVKVVFEGTSIIREITVPNADSFDLLALLGAAPDPFSIRQLQFPTAPRRTL